MGKKKVVKNTEFYIIGTWVDVEGPFGSMKDCEEFLSQTEDGGNYTITQTVVKYEVKVPQRKNTVTKKEI